MKCNFCEEQLENITFSGVPYIWLENEAINLYVCTSRDCKNCGAVLAIPNEAKE